MKHIKKIWLLLCVALVSKAQAVGLPTPVAPGGASGDYIAQFTLLFKKAWTFVTSGFGAVAFLAVAAAAIWTFLEIRKGQKEYADLGMVVGVGGGLLVLVFFLLGESNTIF